MKFNALTDIDRQFKFKRHCKYFLRKKVKEFVKFSTDFKFGKRALIS